MKHRILRFACLLTALVLLPVFSLADAALTMSSAAAAELFPVLTVNKKKADATILRDDNDATAVPAKNVKSFAVTISLDAGDALQTITGRLSALPASAVVRVKNSAGKMADVLTVADPGAVFTLRLSNPVSGNVQLEFTFSSGVNCALSELHVYGAGQLPAAPAFRAGRADVLYIVPTQSDLDQELIRSLAAEGRSVKVALLSASDRSAAILSDELLALGSDLVPFQGTLKSVDGLDTAAKISKTWPEKNLLQQLTSAIRAAQPQIVLYGGAEPAREVLAAALAKASELVCDAAYEVDDAARKGLWAVDRIFAAGSDEAALALSGFEDKGDSLLRQGCAASFADALHADPASIPYPDTLQSDGFLSEGEFLWEDEEHGIWAYASPTVAVQIIRYEQPAIPRIWFVSDVRFKPGVESFASQQYEFGFPGQQIYPETLAQSSRMVFAINSDYYIYRKDKHCAGNIIRAGRILYTMERTTNFPCLDTMALHDDGSMSVYAVGEVTAQQLLDLGDVHDALSFGPYLVRDGRLRVYTGPNFANPEPRCAVGMVSPGHYKVITVEGRFNKGYGPAGVSLNMLGQMLYAEGVQQGFNLDGGNTSVLIFMGKKINRTASKQGTGVTSPRNMSELFGVGHSELVRTEKIIK